MTYCVTEIDSPSFFAVPGDCGEPVAHDLRTLDGGLSGKERIAVSAALIQLNTDSRYLGERGWWGDEFQPFAIGSRLWRVPLDRSFPLARVDEMIRQALGPLISQGVTDEIRTNLVRTVAGVDAIVELVKGGNVIFRTVVN
jgi:phage gp46-like protein